MMFEDVEFTRGNRRVVWEYIGEGWGGDYDPEDEQDDQLLRFTCFSQNESGEWEYLEDSSYCTRMPIDSPIEHLERGAQAILDVIEDASYKRGLEYLSWLAPEDFSKGAEDVD